MTASFRKTVEAMQRLARGPGDDRQLSARTRGSRTEPEGGRAEIDGEVHAKSNAGQIVERLTAALDQRWQPEPTFAATDESHAVGTRQTNPFSGIDEEYRCGFWLLVTTIQAGLDVHARRIINDLSAVAIGCLDDSDLNLEIGGHTDSLGADDMNLKLSQSRADAMLDQLIARGVAANALTASGYGETEPIADKASIDAGPSITARERDGPALGTQSMSRKSP